MKLTFWSLAGKQQVCQNNKYVVEFGEELLFFKIKVNILRSIKNY